MAPSRKPTTPEASSSSSSGSSSSKKRRIVDYFAKPAASTASTSTSKLAPPSWGKQVDPVLQRRWQLVSNASPPVAWAIRSYRMSYVPVFQVQHAHWLVSYLQYELELLCERAGRLLTFKLFHMLATFRLLYLYSTFELLHMLYVTCGE
jgi:hypothetical protein